MNELVKHGYLTKKPQPFLNHVLTIMSTSLNQSKTKGDKNDTITINNAIGIFGFYISWRRFM